MLLALAPLVFALLVASTPLSPNASSSTSSAPHFAVTLDVAVASSTSASASTFNLLAYYDPAAFVNPYFFVGLDPVVDSDPARLSSVRLCSSVWNTAFTSWLGSAKVTTGPVVAASTETTTYYPWFSTTEVLVSFTETVDGSITAWTSTSTLGVSTVLGSTVTSVISGQGPEYLVPSSFDFTASQPCCERCTIQGGNVQVFYWPSASPSISTLINSNNFTFVYPSTYVAFESIHATDMCGAVGPTFASTTMAFAPGDLSTAEHAWVSGPDSSSLPFFVALASKDLVWTRATFGGDQQSCGPQTTTIYAYEGEAFSDRADALAAILSMFQVFSIEGVDPENIIRSGAFTFDPCSPTLSIPSQILTIAPQWSSCVPPVTALYDPPFPISPGSVLVAFGASTSPAPGPTAQPETASITPSTAPVVAPLPTQAPPPANSVPPSSVEIQPVQIITVSSTPPQVPVDLATSPAPNLPAVANNGEPPAPSNPAQNPTTASSAPAVLNFGSSSITVNQASNFVIDSQTLAPGGALTISGTTLSMASNGAFVVLDGTITQTLTTPTTAFSSPNNNALVSAKSSSSVTIGAIILSAGGFATNTDATAAQATETQAGSGTYNGTVFSGRAARRNSQSSVWILGALLGIGILRVS